MRKFKQKRKFSFRKGLLIYTVALAVLLLAALGVLFDFMTVYERSRPENFAAEYLASVTDASVKEIMNKAYPAEVGAFENASEVYDTVFSDYFRADGLKIRKKVGEYTDENPVYTVLSGSDVQMYKITLEKSADDLRYGFENWQVRSTEVIDGEIVAETGDYTVTVPESSEVFVNGKILTGSELSRSGLIFRGISEFEKSTENSAKCEKYVITGLYNVPEIKVLYKNEPIPVTDEDGDYFADYPEADFISAEIKVPSGAEVKINGIAADEKYVTATEAYPDLTPFESGDGFTMDTYRFTGLLSEPAFSVIYSDAVLEADGNVYHFPEEKKKSVKVTVPLGAELKLNGVTAGEEFRTEAAEPCSLTTDFIKQIKNAPALVTYTVSGLYAEPEITVTENGKNLVPIRLPEELMSVNGLEYAPACENEAVKAAVNARADEFIRKCIYFTSKGKENTAANNDAVVAYFFPGTPSAVAMYQSRYSISWNNAYNSLTYNSIVIDNFVQLSDNCVSCDIAFDVTMERFGINQVYADKFKATFLNFNNTWFIGKLIMNTVE